MIALRAPVLIVEDDKDVRDCLGRALKGSGFDVLLAANGKAVLGLLKANKVSAVLLDIMMPDKDGLETLLEIKREFPRTTVVAMSGSKFDFLPTARKFGADHVLAKPIHPAQLTALFDQIASNAGAA